MAIMAIYLVRISKDSAFYLPIQLKSHLISELLEKEGLWGPQEYEELPGESKGPYRGSYEEQWATLIRKLTKKEKNRSQPACQFPTWIK